MIDITIDFIIVSGVFFLIYEVIKSSKYYLQITKEEQKTPPLGCIGSLWYIAWVTYLLIFTPYWLYVLVMIIVSSVTLSLATRLRQLYSPSQHSVLPRNISKRILFYGFIDQSVRIIIIFYIVYLHSIELNIIR